MEEHDCIQILPYESRSALPRKTLFPTATPKQVFFLNFMALKSLEIIEMNLKIYKNGRKPKSDICSSANDIIIKSVSS